MFLHHLTSAQKGAFLTLAYQFIAADNQLTAAEEQMLGLMKHEMGIPDAQPAPHAKRSDLFAHFDDRASRSSSLLELIGLGYADSEFSPAEDAFVRAMADAFGVDAEELTAMQDWVVRQIALANDANRFLGR